ncbi:MAG: insulinase family protein, partial [Alphaproteobacteria bacterium]|nr:insulinase family protein [Alphaproteobacteria bacterium]
MMRWFAALLAIAWWAIAAPAGAIEIRVVTTPSGVTAWYVHEPALPIIAVDIAFRHGGAAQDPPHREGLAYMMSGLLDEGAGELDSQEFQGRLQDLAVELSADTGLDELRVRFRTLSANRDAAFDLLGLALGQPRFDPEAVERIRRQILSAQRQRAEDPEWLADETWYARAFPDHPYGRPDQGSASSIAAITVEDLRRFARQRLARDVAVIGAIGDVPPAAFAALLERALGGISASAATVDVPETRP